MAGEDLKNPKYKNILQTFALVTKEEGALALWKGNGANVLRVIPVYGLKFAFNDTFKALVAGPSKKRLNTTELMYVGTLAGLFQTVLTYPLETVRTRLTLGPGQGVVYKGIGDCFKEMVRTEGYAGLYKGIGPTIVSGAPYTGIQMTVFELMQRNTSGGDGNVLWQLVNGAVAGLMAQTVTYPGDTVRRRMQNNGAGGSAKIYRNSWHCTVQIFKLEGVSGFFKGAWTNTVRAVPGAAIQFASYEWIKKLIGA
jgi:Mitochondrial carrier protein